MAVNVNDPTASGMILTFDDEFDTNSTSADNVADKTLWSNHLWYDGADPGAISVSNGVLSLASNGELSSVNSAGQGFAQMYGYFEIDMKVPAGVGTWPAFWLMSQAHAQNPSAAASEIDIIEGQGNQNNGYYTTLHSDTGTPGDQVNPMPNFTGNVSAAPLDSEYARFGVLWAPGSTQLTYYFDGKAVATSNEYATTNSSPMMVLIDNWLGDIGWGGNSPAAGQSFGPLQIDYVRVYQFAGQGATAIAPEAVSPAAGQTDPTALANADGVTSGGTATPPAGGTTGTTGTTGATGATPSPNGTVLVGATGDIVTAAGNSFAITAAGQITENGTVLSITNSVTELAYVNTTLYQEATTQNLWWSYNEAAATWTQTTNPLTATTGSTTITAVAPTISVANASGGEGNAIALTITAAQAAANLAAADLTITVGNLNGATLNHGTLSNGVYTLHSTDLAGLTITPGANYAGTLALSVTATDTEPSSNTTASSAAHTLDVTVNPTAVAPSLSVASANGLEGNAIPLSITAAQSATGLATTDLTVTVSNLNGATLNHGTLSNGVYTLHSTDLSGLTVTPAANFTGTLALHVQATDTEAASGTTASSTSQMLDVAVNAPVVTTGGANPGGGTTSTSFNPQAAGMVLTFDDEFNSASISSDGAADKTTWNNHLWYEAANPTGVTVANGVATFAPGSDLSTVDASGQGFAQKYGYFEAKVNFTGGAGDVPAFWLMNAQHVTTATVPATEIDVMHAQTSALTQYTTGVQSDVGQADNSSAGNTINLTSGAHTYGVLWSPNSTMLTWYLDGQEVATTAAPADLSSGAAMLNLSFEPGTGADAPVAGSTPSMQVDWVHVYQYAGQGATAVAPQANFAEPVDAVAPTLTVANATGSEGKAIALTITAAQAATDLAAADLTVTIGNLNGATLNHGTETNGVYTLHSTDLAGLTITPAANFTGTLALHVMATDTEASTGTTVSDAAQTLDVTVMGPAALAPTLSVFQASGTENSATPIYIDAAQSSSLLAPADLTIAVSNLNGATLNHGTLSNGVYTLHSTDLSGLTVTPAANFTGTLALHVQATDTEASSRASSVVDTLNVAVSAPTTSETLMSPTFSNGTHNLYLLNSLSTGNEHIASFNPATDWLDVAPLMNMIGYEGTNPVADHIVNLEPTANGGTAVMIDPTGTSPTHGTTVVTLDHVLPQAVPAADIWH